MTPLAELAAYFRARTAVPDEDLVRLTAAARAAGSRWDDIAATCDIKTYEDLAGVIYRYGGETGAELLYSATQHAVEQLEGSRRRHPPLTWGCPGCGQQVTDRAATGRPIHIEHGHTPGCARLARDQAAEARARRDRLAPLILDSEPAIGAMQRHQLAHRITDDCPRCGWHGYFFHTITIINSDWAAGVCDDCYADLHPHITVTVQFFAVCFPDRPEPLAVVRQRTRSDWGPLDNAEIMTWQLDWHHTPLLIEIASGGSVSEDLVPVSRDDAAQIAVGMAARYWPPDAARLPWVAAAYPG